MKKIIFLLLPIASALFAINACKKKEVIPTMFVEKKFTASAVLYAVKFWDSQKGIAAGKNGTLLRTNDGGTSWAKVSLPVGITCDFDCICLPAKDTGYVSGRDNAVSGFVLRTINGGASWTQIYSASNFSTISFTSGKLGYAAIYANQIYRTTNAGSSWNQVSSTFNSYMEVYELYFASRDTGFLKNENGDHYKTTDGGASWSLYFPPGAKATSSLTSASDYYFFNNKVGAASFSGEAVDVTTDGGTTWNNVYHFSREEYHPLNTVCMPSDRVLMAAGRSLFIASTDGGNTWEKLYTQDGISITDEITDIHFYDEYNGFGVSFEGNIFKFQRVDPVN
jgi:photosystem II stability/assembly factor-like uncharacterized protein